VRPYLVRASALKTKFDNSLSIKLENAELREKHKLKSHNSGKHPSSDGLAKKSIVPKPKGNNQGGQFGHQGKPLKRSEKPDQIIISSRSEMPMLRSGI
jgi:hypothetical protein